MVVTNPPFSLGRRFLQLLIESGKEFIVLGSNLWIDCQQNLRYFYNGKLKLGFGQSQSVIFATGLGEMPICCSWYTSFDIDRHRPFLDLTEPYDPEIHKRFKKFPSIINIDCYRQIPYDWKGVMGVPITFLKYWNPNQFKIVTDGNLFIDKSDHVLEDGRYTFQRLPIQRVN